MSQGTMPSAKKTFALDPAILGPGSAASVEVGGATDSDVVFAVVSNKPFPTRPNGVIDLAHIALTAGNDQLKFEAGAVSLGIEFSAGVAAGAGIFDRPDDAIRALELGETIGLDLTMGVEPNTRYVLLRTRYQANGAVEGSHPIGGIGALTFGASAAASGLSAVLHQFPSPAGAETVLKETIQSWRLPRHIDSAGRLAPASWVIAEATGSVAVNLGARLGYNFNFVRQAKTFGLSGDIGLKIDAAATASFGFDVSGRYLVVVGRESADAADERLRLRMFKLSNNGMRFGLNLKVGVRGVETIAPGSVDDFVKAVFGVHGAQIVSALGQIEHWTDRNKSVGELVAGLTNEKALELIKRTTGIDPEAAFEEARAKLVDAIKLYHNLPATASSELLKILEKIDPTGIAEFRNALTLLSSTDHEAQKQALTNILNTTGFTKLPIGRFIGALADKGLLNLLDRLPDVRSGASTALSILDGGVIADLQDFINKQLDLENVLKNVVSLADFNRLDSFLIGRLSIFFDKTLRFADLNDIKNAINIVIDKRQDIYDKARKALKSRYGADVAATWQRTTANTAIIDAVFDLNDSAAREIFSGVMQGTDSALDKLLTTELSSVRFKAAVLSHEMMRKTTLEMSLPHFNFQTQSVTTALAKVRPEDEGGRILLYEATGSSTVSVRNKFNSSLSMTLSAAAGDGGSGVAGALPDFRVHSTDGNTWSYQLRYAKARMKREELEAITGPFVRQYMASQFASGTNLSAWYNQLEDTSEKFLHNGPEVYGDVCASFEVTIPGDTLAAWVVPVKNVPSAAKNVSIAIQKALKSHVVLFYLTDIGKLSNLASAAPLLAWASIPPAVSFDGSVFSSSAGNDVFWDHVDSGLRKSAARHKETAANLIGRLAELRLRLEEAGMHDTVPSYQNDQVGAILTSATSQFGDILLESLLLFEAKIVEKANEALQDVQKFRSAAGSSPSKAVERLAQFASDIVTAFNQLVGDNVFADLSSFRAVAQVVFAEASRALNPTIAAQPRAMLTLDILNPVPVRTFSLSSFIGGELPESSDVAVAQRLVSV
jgi:hypothetical protein